MKNDAIDLGEMAQRLGMSIALINAKADKNKLYVTLSALEAELRKAGTGTMEFYQRPRDHQLQVEFLKMADFAKATLDEVKL